MKRKFRRLLLGWYAIGKAYFFARRSYSAVKPFHNGLLTPKFLRDDLFTLQSWRKNWFGCARGAYRIEGADEILWSSSPHQNPMEWKRAEFSGVGLGGRLQIVIKEFKKVYDAWWGSKYSSINQSPTSLRYLRLRSSSAINWKTSERLSSIGLLYSLTAFKPIVSGLHISELYISGYTYPELN